MKAEADSGRRAFERSKVLRVLQMLSAMLGEAIRGCGLHACMHQMVFLPILTLPEHYDILSMPVVNALLRQDALS